MAGELPNAFVQQFREAAPSYRQGQNEETDALFNPSITARPLHVPMAGQIAERLNREMEYFWAFDRVGQNPYHERVERLRAVGFDFATTDDVRMAVDSVVKGKVKKGDKDFSNEIRNGDLRLMKVPKRRWLEIRKSQQLQAIMMMNPRGKVMGDNGTVMGVQGLIPGVRTTVSDEPIEDIRSRAVVSNAAQDLRDGQVRGNASVVSSDKVNKR
jgi:hypothetical protein